MPGQSIAGMAAVSVAANGITDNDQAAAASASDGNARRAADVDPRLLMAARCGDSELLKNLLLLNTKGKGAVDVEAGSASNLPWVTMEGDTLLHVVAGLHLAPTCFRDDGNTLLLCADVIVGDIVEKGGGAAAVRKALEARNNKGDTPLHCAASAGNANMIAYLVDLIANDNGGDDAASAAATKKELVRIQNHCGETALHQAVRAPYNNKACIDQLVKHDPDLPYNGTSPLCLAISLGEVEIARYLHSSRSDGNKLLSYSGPDGRNALHAAVSRGQEETRTVLRWAGWLGTTAAGGIGMRQQEDDQLLSQLTGQRDEENGSTPLHLAASLGGLPRPEIIFQYKGHPFFWAKSVSAPTADLLLDVNESMAYQPDKRGLYPIHVAAGAGSVRVVAALLKRKRTRCRDPDCPAPALLKRNRRNHSRCRDCLRDAMARTCLRDAKGRTFLHVAVEERCHGVVRYVCRKSQAGGMIPAGADAAAVARFLSSMILNAQDMNGDTALHRAVYTGDFEVFSSLAGNLMVRLDVKNKEGLTPIDVAWSKMPLKVYYTWDTRMQIRRYLLQVGAPYGKNRGDLFHQRFTPPKQDEDKMSEDLRNAAQVVGLFSVLMTTVTFASAFTLPGGYRSAGDAAAVGGVAGTPVLAGPRMGYAFDAFVLSNALAFLCSLHATSVLLFIGVQWVRLETRFAMMNLAYTLMWQAGRSLLAAFALGLYVVLFPVTRIITIAVVVLVAMSAIAFLKRSEGFTSIIVIGRRRRLSICEFLLFSIIYPLDHFWSYVIIFGLPAIRHKWAK